ncbi:hypothetical protein PR048_005048 [Dryococelus australis]|uniref:PiggyBac transposable element-derived protein domain-containing protein n=1 Tax=Dryococelus australis TaxID=614101 RepID=A0ABQ9I744_9NEOP|nr:hypothetical protein PR048_005048 [Dryococelus australis]
MGGVDRFDQLIQIFYYILDASIVNSYVLYKETVNISSTKEKPMSQLSFLSAFADELIGVHLTNVGVHVPVKVAMRRCAHCSIKNKPKRSSLICKSCQIALSRDCFATFHEQ